jgi:hypothetical protein
MIKISIIYLFFFLSLFPFFSFGGKKLPEKRKGKSKLRAGEANVAQQR